jgi:Fe2+ transport system protein FeoA
VLTSCEKQPNSQSLNTLGCGICARITHITAAPEICRRLQEMGICHSNVIRKISDHGAVVCEVGQSRLVLSSSLVKNIFVEEVSV